MVKYVQAESLLRCNHLSTSLGIIETQSIRTATSALSPLQWIINQKTTKNPTIILLNVPLGDIFDKKAELNCCFDFP